MITEMEITMMVVGSILGIVFGIIAAPPENPED